MARMILAFIVVFGLFHFGIQAWRDTTGLEKWTVVKSLTYSLILAILTLVALTTFVILF